MIESPWLLIYLACGLAWTIANTFARSTQRAMREDGKTFWIGAVVGAPIGILLWPITLSLFLVFFALNVAQGRR